MDLIRRDIHRIAPDVINAASTYAASILADVAGRRGTMDSRLSALLPETRMTGSALTVEVRPGDNLMIHAALSFAQRGDVLVVDGKGDRTCALMGALMITTCAQIGIAGVVIDGAVRDIDDLRRLGVPVYAVCTNPNGPLKCSSGRINYPISCGGVAVSPGDLVIGDSDGVVVIERERANALLEMAARKYAEEQARMTDITVGRNLKPGWLEPALHTAGVLRQNETL